MLALENISHVLPNGTSLIKDLSLILNEEEKVALVGVNGIGKSTLLEIVAGNILPSSGKVKKSSNIKIAYLPQKFRFNTMADVFGFEKQIVSLRHVDDGTAVESDYALLEGYWDCEDIITNKLRLSGFFEDTMDPLRDFNSLSGGEQIKVLLASIMNIDTNFLLLDEPSNNLDREGKLWLVDFIRNWNGAMLLVSHDRELLLEVEKIVELRRLNSGVTRAFCYGGNYGCFAEQKKLEESSLEQDLNEEKKRLKRQKLQILENERKRNESIGQGKRNIQKRRYMKSAMDAKINKFERKQGSLRRRDEANLNFIENSLGDIDALMERKNNIYFKFSEQKAPVGKIGKILLQLENLNFSYGDRILFRDFNLTIGASDRILLTGKNGSGKSTLLNIIARRFGEKFGVANLGFLQQHQDFLIGELTILKNVMDCTKLKELETRNLLAQFLFRTDDVLKKVKDLSGGERLRVALTCVLGKNIDLLLLDEPTNNLDMESVEILENILNCYGGAMVLVSHDRIFCDRVNITKYVEI